MQYVSNEDTIPVKISVSRGYALVFKFIRGDGTGLQFRRLDGINVLCIK